MPLEDIDLGQLILDANKKVEERKSSEIVLQQFDEKTRQINQAVQQELYEAWKNGDTVKLKEVK